MKTKLKLSQLSFLLIFNLIIFNLQSSFAQMFWNQAASFAGNSSSYISIPNSSSIDITGSFTIEAWINPTSLSGVTKGIIAKGGSLGTTLRYALRIKTSGKLEFATNGVARLSGKTAILINKWTHVSATYNSSTNEFRLYLNGVLDTSSIIAGAAPPSNTDSLFVGISGSTTPYNGKLDEVRLWNRSLSSTEVGQYFRTSLGATSGVYSGLVLSMTFQEGNSSGSDFSTVDISSNGNNGNARNITAIDQGNNPYSTIDFNESVQLDGNNDYLVGKDTSTLDAITGVTMECWVYPNSLSSSIRFISKGISPAVYALGYNDSVFAIINGTTISTTIQIPLNQWTHISFKYNSSGSYTLFLNGVRLTVGSNNLGLITNSSDSLYIGGSSSITDFNGYIDDVRITDGSLIDDIITSFAYKSIDLGNDPLPSYKDISYNLDGTLIDNAANGGPKLILRGNAKFSHPSAISGQPVSPIDRDDEGSYYSGYYLKTANKNIPGGIVYDSLRINNDLSITDLNLFVALNHQRSEDLEITITGPTGDSLVIFNNVSTNSQDNNVVTIFDDGADSSLISGRLTSFSPKVKPVNSLNSKFLSSSSKGLWKIKINDNTHGNTGVFYEWGIQINNQTVRERNLDISALMQGFYNPSTNLMIPDTMRVIIRNGFPPYTIQDTVISVLDDNGKGYFSYNDTLPFYIVLKHRNSIETWNVSGLFGDTYYDFIISNSQAFGNNQIIVDTSPNKSAIYSGDVNQDGSVDATDLSSIDNDAFNFVTGYVQTDITGDDLVDASDAAIADNNAFNFISAIVP